MSDAHFDGLRSAGEYPPKGFGCKPRLEQIRVVLNRFKNGFSAAHWQLEFMDELGFSKDAVREYMEYCDARNQQGEGK